MNSFEHSAESFGRQVEAVEWEPCPLCERDYPPTILDLNKGICPECKFELDLESVAHFEEYERWKLGLDNRGVSR